MAPHRLHRVIDCSEGNKYFSRHNSVIFSHPAGRKFRSRRYREVCCVWKKMRNVQLLSKWGQKPAHLQPKVQNDFRIFWPEVSIKSILGTIYHLRLYQCPVGRKWREPFQGTNHSQTGKNQAMAPTYFRGRA